MKYESVSVIFRSGSDRYHVLVVDGEDAEYDIIPEGNGGWRTRFRFWNSKVSYYIPIKLELNRANPKETLDRFFKLLLLS